MSEDNVVIELCGITAGYGREIVLRNVTLKIERGSFLPFVGPNGAGKTTLLRIITGLLKPVSGKLLTHFEPKRCGYVPQQKSIDKLYPVSVFGIVVMGLYPELGWWRPMGSLERELVNGALDELGLLEHSQKRYSELSGGMRQKALIARAFVSDADVLVMDEPTSELDAESEKQVFESLFSLSQKRGKTVLVAIHGMEHIYVKTKSMCAVDHGRAMLHSC